MNVGDKIPDVLGIDQYGKMVHRSDFNNHRLVIYVFPRANTPGCTAEACSFQKNKHDIVCAWGADIVGVSMDSSDTLRKFSEKHGLEFTLISDTEGTLIKELGAWGEKVSFGKKTTGIIRTTYLVKRDGVIDKIFTPKEIKTKTHGEQVLDYVLPF